jgi:hypothetical protein
MSLSFGPTSGRWMPIQHPFVGTSSWLRSVPDSGTKYLLINRFDTGQPEAIKALPVLTKNRSQDYINGTNIYRNLNSGEHDFASAGAALAYLGKRGHLDLRSGATVKAQLNREEQTSRQGAPTHKRELLNWTVGEMGDEERLGIVKRWTTAIDETFPQDANNNFQNEHYLKLKNPAGSAPEILLWHMEGQLYDDDTTPLTHFTSGLPLRSRKFWYTTTDDFVRQEIDQNGNVLMSLPSVATIGHELLIPGGNYRANIGVDREMTIGRDENVSVGGNINYTVVGAVGYTVTGNLNLTAGDNAFTMDVTPGQETVGMMNAGLLGFQAENTSDGGLTSIFGPQGSGMFFNGLGKIQIQDGLGGGAVFEGDAVTMFSKGGALLALGTSTILAGPSGSDYLSIEDQLVQIMSGNTMNIVSQVFNANAGTLFLGANAVQPAVLGLNMMAWTDVHTHLAAAPFAPTSPPIIPTALLVGTPASLYSLSAFFAGNL